MYATPMANPSSVKLPSLPPEKQRVNTVRFLQKIYFTSFRELVFRDENVIDVVDNQRRNDDIKVLQVNVLFAPEFCREHRDQHLQRQPQLLLLFKWSFVTL